MKTSFSPYSPGPVLKKRVADAARVGLARLLSFTWTSLAVMFCLQLLEEPFRQPSSQYMRLCSSSVQTGQHGETAIHDAGE